MHDLLHRNPNATLLGALKGFEHFEDAIKYTDDVFKAIGEDEQVIKGVWTKVNESMSERAAAYQRQITGRLAGEEAYVVNGVKFDGVRGGTLLDAKGLGYSNKLGKYWFEEKEAELIDQARRQLKAANGMPIEWNVAEEDAAEYLRKLFADNDININIVHTPACSSP